MNRGASTIPTRFPIVIYPSEFDKCGRYTAHSLNMDLVADGDTVEGAVENLLEAIEAAFEASRKHNANAFREAPEPYWRMLEQAKELPRELVERIVFTANKRRGSAEEMVNVETQCDLRQFDNLQTA